MNKFDYKLDMHAKPTRPRLYLMVLIWIISFFNLVFSGIKFKIKKEGFKRIKGGTLLISNHMSFEDFKLLELTLCPRTAYYVASIDEFCGKEWFMRHVGCLPKKVHYRDMALIRQIVRLLKNGKVVTIYPEATYSFAGINNLIDQDLGKLAKMANCQVIVVSLQGNYLYSPRWNTLPKNKEVKLISTARLVASKKEVSNLSADQIQDRINKAFAYDEYKYQRDNNIMIKNKTMAHNIERILYKCPNCQKELSITGKDNVISCSHCNAKYNISPLSILKNENGETKFDSISSWYLWQKQFVIDDINNDNYNLEFPIKVSRFINPKLGFDHDFAKGKAIQNKDGIFIDGICKDGTNFHYEYDKKNNATIHLTFDVKGCQESAFEVHNAEESYLIYPLDKTPIVKIRFAVEAAHDRYKKELRK